MSNIPQVSIVTAAYNACASIEKCLRSVADQTGVTCEHIVIDGGSTDGTAEILRDHAARLAYWCSEPDEGIADAMNKGLDHATGRWVAFIHADDCLAAPNVLALALDEIPEGADIAAFPVLFGTEPGRKLVRPRPIGRMTHLKMGMCHQGMLVRREIFQRVGVFDPCFKICMDYEHLIRALHCGVGVFTADDPVLSLMGDGGISSREDWPMLRRRFLEEKRIHKKYAETSISQIVLGVYWWLYLPYRWARAQCRRLD